MPRTQVENREIIANWTAGVTESANVQATATQAAPAAGSRLVLMGFIANIEGGTTAPAAANVTLNIIDGASGGTTYLLRVPVGVTAVAGANQFIAISDIHVAASAATAMTIEFSAAGGANTIQSVYMWGYTTRD